MADPQCRGCPAAVGERHADGCPLPRGRAVPSSQVFGGGLDPAKVYPADAEQGVRTLAFYERWPGRCRRCRVVWEWPRAKKVGLASDLATALCPVCLGGLGRTTSQATDPRHPATRVDVGLA